MKNHYILVNEDQERYSISKLDKDQIAFVRNVELFYKGKFLIMSDGYYYFYQFNPNLELGHTNFFKLFFRDDSIFIAKGDEILEKRFTALHADADQFPDKFMVSLYRWDYVDSPCGLYRVDGGSEYSRYSNSPENPAQLGYISVQPDGSLTFTYTEK